MTRFRDGDLATIARLLRRRWSGYRTSRPTKYVAPRYTYAVYRELGRGRWYWQGPHAGSGDGWGAAQYAHRYTEQADAHKAIERYRLSVPVFTVGVAQLD